MKAPPSGVRGPGKASPSRAPSAVRSGPATARSSPSAAGAGSVAALDVPGLLQLQGEAGNAAVAAAIRDRRNGIGVLQRRVDPTAPPVPPSGTLPHEDPRFMAVKAKVTAAGKSMKAHPKASTEVNQARAAAEPPANDKDAQAKAAKVDDMSQAKPGTFDKAKFVAAVKKAIEANSPKTLEDADAAKGKTGDVKNQVMGEVTKGKDTSAADIKNATAAAPDPGVAKEKPVTPMPVPGAVAKPSVPAADAMPKPVPPEQTNLQAGKHEVEGQMAEAGVDDETLAKSNEPQFKESLAAKQKGEEHAASAPGEVKAAEQNTLGEAKAGAAGSAATQLAGMVAAKVGGAAKVGDSKSAAKAKEESERKQVATEIDKIFNTTKTETEAILKAIDPAVDAEFTKGEADAKAAFEAHHTAKMKAWKDKRYMGGLNYGQWIIDKIMDLPPEVNQFFVDARKVYIDKMEVVISNVADLIGRELTKARDRIAKGRADVKAFVASQPGNLKKYAAEAEQNISGKFEELDQSVDDKQEGLAEDLATKYTEARAEVDKRVQELQDESKGLWSAAKAMVGETIDTILKLKAMLQSLFARVASAVDRILKDPMSFLGNFVKAVRAGLDKFVQNIGTHLKKGLQGWLFGALADAGIEIPDTFDFKGILKLVLSIIGATWTALRAMIVARIGEPVMAKIEKGVAMVKTLITEGPAGLWKMFMAKMGDIKSMVMNSVKNFIITKVIVAGITWLIGMLNPASAFAKAVKMIVDVVNFFVEKGEAIKGVVDSAVESVEEILSGGSSKVAGMIEGALAKVVPVLIGLLASLLGLGGISEKIKSILEKLRSPVNKAMNFVVGKVVKIGKGLLRKLKNSKLGKAAAKAKAKVKAGIAKGKAYVKKKVAGAKKWVKKKLSGKANPGKAADAVMGVAAKSAARADAEGAIKGAAVTAGSSYLESKGRITVSAAPKVQRTTDASVKVEKPAPLHPDAEEKKTRSSQPKNPDLAAKILTLVAKKTPPLINKFHDTNKSPRKALDKMRAEIMKIVEANRAVANLPPKVRTQAMKILNKAREYSRTNYYNKFRDFAWKALRKDSELKALLKGNAKDAKFGKGGKSALSIRVEVTAADGKKTTRMRAVDFEHLTRVTDNPTTSHMEGGKPNLVPMLGDLNRYYQEGMRDTFELAKWNQDEISRFVASHNLYKGAEAPEETLGAATGKKPKPGDIDWEGTVDGPLPGPMKKTKPAKRTPEQQAMMDAAMAKAKAQQEAREQEEEESGSAQRLASATVIPEIGPRRGV